MTQQQTSRGHKNMGIFYFLCILAMHIAWHTSGFKGGGMEHAAPCPLNVSQNILSIEMDRKVSGLKWLNIESTLLWSLKRMKYVIVDNFWFESKFLQLFGHNDWNFWHILVDFTSKKYVSLSYRVWKLVLERYNFQSLWFPTKWISG